MQDKKKHILEAAIRCFARKGFHASSIQEIVDEAGIAKGSMYFYFKSKDELLVSVLDYYGERMFELLEVRPDEWSLSPREQLTLQFERQFGFIREHLDFMRMLMKEPMDGVQPQIKQLMYRMRARGRLWNVTHIIAIYGQEAERYLGDAVLLMAGITQYYFEAILFGEGQFDDSRLSRFLVERLDDLVYGMLRAGAAPVAPKPDIAMLKERAGMPPADGETEALLEKLALAPGEGADASSAAAERELAEAVDYLKWALSRPFAGNPLLAKGMIALLRQRGPAEWQEPLERLALKLEDESDDRNQSVKKS